jgi:hypothetical protein
MHASWVTVAGGRRGAQVNRIRASLGQIARNSSAFGLAQPHLERTRLCELADADLDPLYRKQRDGLRALVRQLARPKLVSGQARCFDVYNSSRITVASCMHSSLSFQGGS